MYQLRKCNIGLQFAQIKEKLDYEEVNVTRIRNANDASDQLNMTSIKNVE